MRPPYKLIRLCSDINSNLMRFRPVSQFGYGISMYHNNLNGNLFDIRIYVLTIVICDECKLFYSTYMSFKLKTLNWNMKFHILDNVFISADLILASFINLYNTIYQY